MPKPARNQSPQPAPRPRPTVVDERVQKRAAIPDSGHTVRTLIYIEVGDMPVADVQRAVADVSRLYATSQHPTFICPVRHGKLTTDVLFEQEVLEFVRRICTVQDGQIVLRPEAVPVEVFRTTA